VNFDFSAEQYALRDLARDLFEKESPPSRLRELYEGAERDPGAWRSMAAVGLLGLTVPEEHGGMGGDEVDLALVLEEAGRAALPEPLLETVGVAAPALVGSGDPRAATWLPLIAGGEAIATIRMGAAPFAIDADLADVLLEERNGALHLLERGSFTTRPVSSEDRARRLFAVESQTTDATSLPGGAVAVARALDRAAFGAAGMLNGISMRLLQMTLTHVKERQQFGRPVGSFQALNHRLADAHIAVESARAATWYAAYALARDLGDAPLAASVAKAQATDAEALTNRVALQCHAGIGFTWEHDLHLWLKRGKALEQAYGSAADHRARIARGAFSEGDAYA
jgi:alkylation response protein AidB-like acyl-CoA dehydrogenase